MYPHNFRKWMVGAATLATVGFVSLSTLDAQTILYSTTFDSTEGYNSSMTLSGQPGNGAAGSWDTNDADNGATTSTPGKSIGQSDFVGFLGGYSTSASDYWAALGGVQHGSTPFAGVVPGESSVYLFRQFSAPGAVPYLNFDVDFAIAESSAANGSSTNDKFAWTVQAGGVNLLSARFVPDSVDPVTGRLIFGMHYTIGNGPDMTTSNGVLSSSIYHLKIAVNVANNTFNIMLVPSNGDPSFQTGDISLGGLDATLIDSVAATWNVTDTTTANGGYINAGSNSLVFNNYVISVPEPSTWAMAGIGLAGLMVVAYRRRARA